MGRLLQQSAFRSKTTIDFAKSPFIAKPLKKRRSISLKKSTARQQKFFRAPKSHDASILFGKHIANAKDFSIVFEHRDRSREASARRSISVVKSTARQQKMFGPRKPRCVDFFMQTYSERYDFFDRFRSVSSTAIDRGIGIGRFGVEKTTFDFCRENIGRASKKLFGPRKPRCVDFSRQV